MERGMSLAREGKDAALELQVTENLASLLSLAKRQSVAVPLFQDLVARHRAAGSRERLSTALTMLGQALTVQGQLATALECLHGSLEEARAISSPDAEMRALGSLANCYDVLYQVYRALDAGTRAAKLAKELGERRSFAIALQIRCRQLRLLGDHTAARELIPHVMEATQTRRRTGSQPRSLPRRPS
jgi:tetratricopeptide (TPR) repeat protein